jgi:hypothetical protein
MKNRVLIGQPDDKIRLSSSMLLIKAVQKVWSKQSASVERDRGQHHLTKKTKVESATAC